ncbi:MAG: hypothetical protein SGARI_006511 [Bacillariaceae sp.]
MSPKKHRVRRIRSKQERRKRNASSRVVSLEGSSHSQRSEEVVKQLISQISFTKEGAEYEEIVKDDADDAFSVVSSLGMGLTDDDQDLEGYQDDKHHDDRSCGQDSIARITSQIKRLRRSSMERFQATPPSKRSLSLNSNSCDSTKPPTLPTKSTHSIPSLSSCDDQSCDDDDGLQWQPEDSTAMPLTRHAPRPRAAVVSAFEECSRQRFLPFLTATANELHIGTNEEPMHMSQSLPKDLHILAMPCRCDSDIELDDEDDATSYTSFGSDTPITLRRTDRWGSGGSKSMERDCALVKESFEWAQSLRHNSSCHSSVDSFSSLSGIHNARKVQSERSAPRDTMLVPPRRRL